MDCNTTANVTGTILQFVSLFSDIVVLLIPWMILAAIKAVKTSVDKSNKAIVTALQQIHEDLCALGGAEE